MSEPACQLLVVWKGVLGLYAPVMECKVLPFINTPLLCCPQTLCSYSVVKGHMNHDKNLKMHKVQQETTEML